MMASCAYILQCWVCWLPRQLSVLIEYLEAVGGLAQAAYVYVYA